MSFELTLKTISAWWWLIVNKKYNRQQQQDHRPLTDG